jgi:uncharacterized Zn finger protein
MPRYGGYDGYGYGGFPPYVPVAARRARALAAGARLIKGEGKGKAKKGTPERQLFPVAPIQGHKIARSFWGQAWCANLESYSDYANRLPRGRSYVRHGCVADLQIDRGRVTALVSGTDLYKIAISIKPLPDARWEAVTTKCVGQIDSLVALLRGNLPDPIMEVVTNRDHGLFPSPREIELDCSCPDWADMCKHVAAALYGVGARLDEKPELLFALRGVDHLDLLEEAAAAATSAAAPPTGAKVLDPSDLSSLFGIEIDTALRGPARGRPATPPASAGNGRATKKKMIVAAPVMASSPTAAKRAIRSKPRKTAKVAKRPTQVRGIADLIAAALTRAFTGGRRRGHLKPTSLKR